MSINALTKAVTDAAGPYRYTEFHGEIISVKKDYHFATKKDGKVTNAASIYTLQPRKRDATKLVLNRHDVAIIDNIRVAIIPGPMSVTKMLTITGAWIPSNVGSVETLEELAQIPGRRRFIFGGPNTTFEPILFPLPSHFNHVLKSPITTEDVVLHFAVESVDITGAAKLEVASGSWFDLDYTMEYKLYGGLVNN